MSQQPMTQQSTAPSADLPQATMEAEAPAECPLSHRVARRASVTVIAVLCVLIAATVIYVLVSGA